MAGRRATSCATTIAVSESTETNTVVDQVMEYDGLLERSEEANDEFSDFVVYQKENETDELTGYDLDKKLGRPHPFIDLKVRKPIKELLTSEELWWNWRKPDKEQWSRWQRKCPDAETIRNRRPYSILLRTGESLVKDTSRKAIQKHYEETCEDENAQLIEMFYRQTAREYRIMCWSSSRACMPTRHTHISMESFRVCLLVF
ncbi:putative protein PLASTID TRANSCRIPTIONALLY ACTIVE 12 [Helianthus annuus]|nr:putative protein PLASTID TRANSCRIPTIONALLY ACTIVE 12 [Helianthus annuus]KAJ0882918.1 putative protein PLASTID TRANSCRIPTIONALLY ACTIVE 12 [Helianthus annuus]